MHILSKICLVLVVLLAPFGFYLSGSLATKRNALTEQIVKQKKLRDENIEKIASAKITRGKEADELNRLMEGWGRQWTAKGQSNGQQPTFILNIGTQQGLGLQEQVTKRPGPSVYLFYIEANGTSRYLGEFVAEPGPQTLLTLARPPYPNEVESWPQQGDFRVRERIPPGMRAMFHDLLTHQAIADQQVINETAKKQIQDNHIAASQKTLDQRMAELNGDPAAPANADKEIVDGFVQTLRVEEAERNAVLKDVDALRRALSDSYARLEKVLAENKQSVEAMTPAAGTETAGTETETAARGGVGAN